MKLHVKLSDTRLQRQRSEGWVKVNLRYNHSIRCTYTWCEMNEILLNSIQLCLVHTRCRSWITLRMTNIICSRRHQFTKSWLVAENVRWLLQMQVAHDQVQGSDICSEKQISGHLGSGTSVFVPPSSTNPGTVRHRWHICTDAEKKLNIL